MSWPEHIGAQRVGNDGGFRHVLVPMEDLDKVVAHSMQCIHNTAQQTAQNIRSAVFPLIQKLAKQNIELREVLGKLVVDATKATAPDVPPKLRATLDQAMAKLGEMP